MPSTSGPSHEHRVVTAAFTVLVLGAPPESWDNPSPVAAWRARDVVGHLVEWLPHLLEGGSEVRLPATAPILRASMAGDAAAIGAAILPFLDQLLPSDATLMQVGRS